MLGRSRYSLRRWWRKTPFSIYAFTPVVKRVIVLNCIIYIITLVLKGKDGSILSFVQNHLFLIPSKVIDGELHQLLTYMFLHDLYSPLHIIFNMFVLWIFGGFVERRVGSSYFFKLYILSGIGGAILHCIFGIILPEHFGAPAIGASGAILGIVTLFALLFPDVKLYLFFLLPISGKHTIPLVIIVDIIFFLEGSNIAILVHFGGILSAFVISKQLWKPKNLHLWLKAKVIQIKLLKNKYLR